MTEFESWARETLARIDKNTIRVAVAQDAHERHDNERFASQGAWLKGIALILISAAVAVAVHGR